MTTTTSTPSVCVIKLRDRCSHINYMSFVLSVYLYIMNIWKLSRSLSFVADLLPFTSTTSMNTTPAITIHNYNDYCRASFYTATVTANTAATKATTTLAARYSYYRHRVWRIICGRALTSLRTNQYVGDVFEVKLAAVIAVRSICFGWRNWTCQTHVKL